MVQLSPEKGGHAPSQKIEAPSLAVVQPSKVQFENFLESLGNVAETIAEDAASDLPQTGRAAGGAVAGAGTQQTSQRSQMLAALPAPLAMQQKLAEHIRREVKELHKQAVRISQINKPGGAYKLNKIYAKMRRLNALLSELWDASYEALKRLFVRVFIDKQPIE